MVSFTYNVKYIYIYILAGNVSYVQGVAYWPFVQSISRRPMQR